MRNGISRRWFQREGKEERNLFSIGIAISRLQFDRCLLSGADGDKDVVCKTKHSRRNDQTLWIVPVKEERERERERERRRKRTEADGDFLELIEGVHDGVDHPDPLIDLELWLELFSSPFVHLFVFCLLVDLIKRKGKESLRETFWKIR